MLFKFGKIGSPLCSFFNLKGKAPHHLFYKSSHTNYLRNRRLYFLSNSLNTPPLTPQSTIFGLINQKGNFLISNHLLFIIYFYTYNSSWSGKVNAEYLKTIIYKTRNIELEISKTATRGKQKYIKKWQAMLLT